MSKCVFEFSKNQDVFYSGETIEGTVTLKTIKTKTIQSININLFGLCQCRWDEDVEVTRSDGNKYMEKNTVWSRKVVADESIELHGPGELPPNTYKYFFDFKLGSHFLTSCEGKHGCLRYEIFLTIDREGKYSNEFSKPITVIKPFDLNIYYNYNDPIATELTDATTTCCRNSMDKTQCVLSTPYSGYAPGQTMAFTVDTSNTSSRSVSGFYITFVKKMTFMSKHPKITEKVVESELMARHYRHPQRSARQNISDIFVIPATSPTISVSGMLNVEYFLKVCAKAKFRLFSNFETQLKITIGTVPLKASLSPDQFDSNNEILPPTFEEDVPCDEPFSDGDANQVNFVVGFRPLYPMFRFPLCESTL